MCLRNQALGSAGPMLKSYNPGQLQDLEKSTSLLQALFFMGPMLGPQRNEKEERMKIHNGKETWTNLTCFS